MDSFLSKPGPLRPTYSTIDLPKFFSDDVLPLEFQVTNRRHRLLAQWDGCNLVTFILEPPCIGNDNPYPEDAPGLPGKH